MALTPPQDLAVVRYADVITEALEGNGDGTPGYSCPVCFYNPEASRMSCGIKCLHVCLALVHAKLIEWRSIGKT